MTVFTNAREFRLVFSFPANSLFCLVLLRFRPKIVQKCQTRIFRLKIGISGINIGKFFKIKSEIQFWKWKFQIFETFVLKCHFKIENSNLWSLNRKLIFKKEFSNSFKIFLESILAFFGIFKKEWLNDSHVPRSESSSILIRSPCLNDSHVPSPLRY